jgi:hypothetical protein
MTVLTIATSALSSMLTSSSQGLGSRTRQRRPLVRLELPAGDESIDPAFPRKRLLTMVRAPSTVCRVVTPKTEHRTLYLLDWSYNMDERRFDRIVCELDAYPGWRILPEVDVTEAGLLLRRLVIEPSGPVPPAGITTRMLRQLRTGDLIAALRAASRQSARYFGESPDLSVNTRVGRRGRDDLYYARWAAAYTDALTRSARPVADLATRHNLSASQIRNLMHACRRRRLLTASPPGRPGGQLTPRAISLLTEPS